MADKNYIKVADILNEEEISDILIMDEIIISTKYNRMEQSDIDRLKKWNIKEVLSTTSSSSTIVSSDNFEKFIADRKIFLVIYEKVLKKMKINFHNFRYNNSLNIQELKETVDELYGMIIVNLSSALSIVNLYSASKDVPVIMAMNVSILSMMIGIAAGLDEKSIKEIGLGGMLYDIGMFRIQDSVRTKVGKYTDEEYTHMKTHTILGYKILKHQLHLDDKIALIPLTHHESYNGTGYPRALAENKIPSYPRIVSIANSFESMVNNLSYHSDNIRTPYAAMKEIVKESSKKFDPYFVKVFVAIMSLYPIGSIVVLNNGKTAMVFSSNKDVPIRPILKVIKDENGVFDLKGEVINLLNEKNLLIKSISNDKDLLPKIFL